MCAALAQETSSEFPYLRLYLPAPKTSALEGTQVGGGAATVSTTGSQSIWIFGNFQTINSAFHFLWWRPSMS